jgi:phosphoribosyl-dephospho-CoA transferase
MSDAEISRIMKQLEETIRETLTESTQIQDQLQEIREAGYELLLVVEAKVALNRQIDKEDAIPSDGPVELKITPEDAKFLKSLKISVE